MVEGPAGWHPDPYGTHELRYFDGTEWTEHVSDQGQAGTAPAAYPSAPAAPPIAPVGPPPGVAAPAAGSAAAVTAPTFPLSGYSVTTRVLVFLGAGLLIFGSFLPWVKASIGLLSVERTGMDGDGVFTLALGVAAILVFGLLRNAVGRVLTLLAAILAAAVAFYDVIDVQQAADDLTSPRARSRSTRRSASGSGSPRWVRSC